MTKTDCPFALPFETTPWRKYSDDKFAILDRRGTMFADFSLQEARYVIRAVNNFEKMREMLRPFATAYEGRTGWSENGNIGGSALTNGDLRRAAAVLKEIYGIR